MQSDGTIAVTGTGNLAEPAGGTDKKTDDDTGQVEIPYAAPGFSFRKLWAFAGGWSGWKGSENLMPLIFAQRPRLAGLHGLFGPRQH